MKYLVAEAKSQDEITAYLEDWGLINEIAPAKHNKVAAIVSAHDEDAGFVSGRLHSGLMGGRIFDALEDAHELYDWLTDLS